MSEVEVRTDVDLNELYDQDVPCNTCGNSAQLRSMGHQVNECGMSRFGSPPFFKCIGCWQKWASVIMGDIASSGSVMCAACKRLFHTVESFADYRPF